MSYSDPSALKPNLNVRLYGIARSTQHGFLRRLPAALVPPRTFPEVPITVAVNGFGDITAQRRYLQLLKAELCAPAPAHPHPQRRSAHPSMAAPLGRIVPMGRPQLTLLNSAWSHFVIAAVAVRRAGACDPGFPGIGFEDMNDTARAACAGIANRLCPYLSHHDHQPTTTSFDRDSGRVWGKYTSANQAHFHARGQERGPEEGVAIRQLRGHGKPVNPPVIPISLPRTLAGCGPGPIRIDAPAAPPT
jgi:hypothetical protein